MGKLREIEQECFGDQSWTLLDLIGVLTISGVVRVKAVMDGEMIGFAAAESKAAENTSWITTIGVRPAYRRQGVAVALLGVRVVGSVLVQEVRWAEHWDQKQERGLVEEGWRDQTRGPALSSVLYSLVPEVPGRWCQLRSANTGQLLGVWDVGQTQSTPCMKLERLAHMIWSGLCDRGVIQMHGGQAFEAGRSGRGGSHRLR